MPYKDKQKRKEYLRLYRLLHIEKIKERDRQYQHQHQTEKNENLRKWRDKQKERGLCLDCKREVLIGLERCPFCLRKIALSAKGWRRKNPIYLERAKARRKYWEANGKCYKCGAPLIEDEIKYCINCSHKRGCQISMKGVLKYETAD